MYRPKDSLHLLIFVTAFIAMAVAPASARADLGELVPAYIYPSAGGSTGDWASIIAAAQQIPVTAIFNPNSGPGPSYNSDYGAALNRLEGNGGAAIAYVYTDYGFTPLATVEGEIQTYISQYGSTSPYGNLVNGFFLDAMSTDPAMVGYYNALDTFIKGLSPSYDVVGNAGTTTDEAYLTTPTADTIVTYENNNAVYPYAGATPPSWVDNYPASRFAAIIYNETSTAGMMADISLAYHRNVGYVYVTDQTLPNPYGQLPSYWDQEVAAIASVPEPSSLTIVAACALMSLARVVRRRTWDGARGSR